MGREGVLELADDIAGWVILARKEMRGLRGIDKSVSSDHKSHDTHPILGREDGTSRAIDEGTAKLLGTLPNNLSEVRVGRVLGIVVLRFVGPPVDPIGDGEISTSSGSQVLCGINHENLV